jgi:hypothetical protein
MVAVFGRVPFPAGFGAVGFVGVAATGAAGSDGGASGAGSCARRFNSSIFDLSVIVWDCVGRGRLEPLREIDSLSRGAGGGAGGGGGAGAGARAGAGFAGSFLGWSLEHPATANASAASTPPLHFEDLFIAIVPSLFRPRL